MSSGLPGVPLGPPLPFPPADNATTPASPVNPSTTPPSPDVASQPSPATLIISPPSSVNGSFTPPKESSNKTTLVALGVGIGIGGALVLICVGIFTLWYKRRKRRLGLNGFGHAPSSQDPKDNLFRGQTHHWQQSAPPSAENMMRIPLNSSPPRAPPSVTSSSQVSSIDGCTPALPPSTGGNLSYDKPSQQTTPDSNLSFSRTTFTYQELAFATDNFSVSNLLGQGGFGYVYKGVFHDGKEVAIKQVKAGSGQGEREFQAEVEIFSHVHHKHLVLDTAFQGRRGC